MIQNSTKCTLPYLVLTLFFVDLLFLLSTLKQIVSWQSSPLLVALWQTAVASADVVAANVIVAATELMLRLLILLLLLRLLLLLLHLFLVRATLLASGRSWRSLCSLPHYCLPTIWKIGGFIGLLRCCWVRLWPRITYRTRLGQCIP